MALSLPQIEERLHALTVVQPFDSPHYQDWLRSTDIIDFLNSTSKNLVPVLVAMGHAYIYSVLVRSSALFEGYVADIMGWSLPPSSRWGCSVSLEAREARDVSLAPPLEMTGSKILDQGEPVVFLRYFEGRCGKKGYPELNQRISHILDAHWLEERSAYCRLNELGDFDDAVPIKNDEEGTVVAIALAALEPYMLLTDSVLIRLFDFARCDHWGDLVQKEREEETLHPKGTGIHARLLIVSDDSGPRAAKLRGFQVIGRIRSDAEILRALKGEDSRPERYESYIALDFKHRSIHECSCAPDKLGNYFIPSALPYETSPAFFRAEVLAKYKQDLDKYRVDSRMISCRGGWTLQYDINEEGQVHVYLVDLGKLPHAEQVYWKAFNESPRAGISKRAWTTDFLAEFSTDYDPLVSLKQALAEPLRTNDSLIIWAPDEEAISQLGHVVTESVKEWKDAVLTLAKILVDGFRKRNIQRIAKELGCYNESLGSIKQLCCCLKATSVSEENVETVIQPLLEVQSIRSTEGIAHRGEPETRSTKIHFRDLLARCDRGMRRLTELIDAGSLNSRSEA